MYDTRVMLYLLCREVICQPHTIWLDNFSKTYRLIKVELRRGAVALSLWAAEGVHRYYQPCYTSEMVNMNLMHDRNDEIIPALPDNFMSCEDQVSLLLQRAHNLGEDLYRTSLVGILNTNNVPIKPLPDQLNLQRHKQALVGHRDGMVDFYPNSLHDINPSSDVGLVKMIQLLKDKITKPEYESKYICVVADVNIFSRILKVS